MINCAIVKWPYSGESMTSSLNCFKAYDVRGKVPEELDKELAYKIGQAYAAIFKPERVIPPEIEPMNSFITTCLETVSML